ncbi:nucleotidyltransferase family protein [Polynucleobacter sp. MWH-HuK1]|nr:nucleotidyltransferase family protein [Polynucleobacter sp. MWH-HuK1]MBU3564444.1 nucleotidyltransferase family protein [Polynucleobacter sp. MWH-HuK1]
MAVVVDAENRLTGTLTDGDIRRHLLAGGSLDAQVAIAMNPNPLSAEEGSSDGYIKDLMRRGNVVAIPLLDRDRKYLRLIHLMDMDLNDSISDNAVGFSFAVIMAGGEGTRLRPLTETIPKPMVEIGGAPLLERQIQRLVKIGIPRVYISVNYLGHIIEEYFGNGEDFGIEISYLREQEKLGTAGALTLLPEHPTGPILVMNGDILTTSDLDSFYHFHNAHAANITIAAIDHRVHVPYGVIRTDGAFITGLVEKPSERFLCNAGIYALSPQALIHLEKNIHSNMTDLVNICLTKKLPVAVFPVHEYWNDIGTPSDLEKARIHFSKMEINNE